MIKRRKRRQKMRILMMSLCRAIDDAISVQNVHNDPDGTSFEIIPRASIVLVTQLIVKDR